MTEDHRFIMSRVRMCEEIKRPAITPFGGDRGITRRGRERDWEAGHHTKSVKVSRDEESVGRLTGKERGWT